ncbi:MULTISPECIES: DUF6520 family protein [Chitinophaga]|jgi:hypothetical protein|uniref:Uncharacterized protein n=2 Tax=Chitinophaga pinensis TaxID=79329 RepID=A0A5C6LMZ9_9BACT|nr:MULTISPECIES: DUF6520 family protein [Chitinophaga]TWV94316.1 hypothetical protein FEF09_25925 [Chitinophaga pinensis]
MKKLRFSLMAVAVILAAGTAVATNMQTKAAKAETKYFRSSNGQFYEAGIRDYDYICEWAHFTICTYTFDSVSGTYKESESGRILFLR